MGPSEARRTGLQPHGRQFMPPSAPHVALVVRGGCTPTETRLAAHVLARGQRRARVGGDRSDCNGPAEFHGSPRHIGRCGKQKICGTWPSRGGTKARTATRRATRFAGAEPRDVPRRLQRLAVPFGGLVSLAWTRNRPAVVHSPMPRLQPACAPPVGGHLRAAPKRLQSATSRRRARHPAGPRAGPRRPLGLYNTAKQSDVRHVP